MAKGKKQEDPNKVAQRKAERVAFVQNNPQLAPEAARQRFYVQTRANELEAAGKDVDRAALRAKFQSGGVTREGFYTPGDISRFNASRNTESLSESKTTPTAPVAPVAPSATSVPTPVKSKANTTTSGVKTPPTSYQAPQTTTALGQVAQPPSGTLAASKNNSGPNVRAGVGTRRVDTSMPSPNVPQIAGVTWRAPGDLPDAVITTPQRVPTPVKGKAPQLSGKGGQNLAARRAQQDKWKEEEFAADRLVNTGLVMGAEVLGGVIGSKGGPASGVAGAALFAGAAYNLTNRLTNWRTQGQYEGDTTLKGAATVTGVSAAAGGATLGVIKALPKVAQQWGRVQNWANDVRVAAPAPKALPQTTGKASGGPKGQVIETNVGRIAPRSMAVAGEQPFKPVAETVESKAANKVKDKVVNLVRRNKAQEAVQTVAPKSAPTILPAEPVAPKFTPEVTRESGLVIPATTNRTPASERSPVLQKALDDVLGKPAAQEPVSLGDSKANTVAQQLKEDGVAELTPRQVAARKGAATRKANREKALEIKQPEIKTETIGGAKPDPVPNVTPTPAPMRVVQGEAPDRLTQMRNHPAFTSKLPEAPPSLSVVKDDGVREINISFNDEPIKATTKNPPRQRPNETAEAYGKRLDRWQLENSGEVFKAPAGFEQPRGTTSFREGAMERIQGGMSRTRRSVAFIDDGSGMSPEGFPVQMEGESVMQFNIRASEFLKSRGKATPQAPDNSFLAEGTPEPVSLAGSKEAAAAAGLPPKPKGLGRNAFYDAEKGEWVAGVLDKKSGKIVAKGERTVYATEEERIAGKKAYEAQRNADRRAKRAANKTVKETELKAAATPVSSNAELGPFMFGGEPVGRSRVMLEPGQVPDWAQQNVSLTGQPKELSQVEDIWLNKEMTPEENAFFRELGNAKKASAGKRVVRSTRKPTPEEVKEYVSRFRGLRAERTEKGLSPGATPVALTDTQIQLEKEIEQVLGTDAMVALRNTAIRGNTPALTQNVRGLESLAEIKATSGEPLLNKLVVRQATPTSGGKLREQAANFFNAEGRLKGVSGADRVRTWNRLTKSDWFRQLQEREPSFANFLREQNSDIAGRFDTMLSRQVEQLPKPGLRRMKPMRGMGIEEEERFISGQLANEQTDDGLGAYKLTYGETPQEGLRARDSGTTVEQRAKAASIESSLEFRARATRRVVAEDTEAFGYVSKGRIEGFSDPATEKAQDILRNYGVLDPNGILTLEDAQFAVARRELDSPYVSVADSRADEVSAAIEAKRKETVARWRANEITKEQMNAEMLEFRTQLYDAPSTGLPANPFAQDFGTQLPKDYVQETPESFGKVWDPDTFTNELGNRVSGRWVTRQEAAEKAQKRIDKQAVRTSKMELERENFYSTRWLDVAKRRAIAARSAKPEPTPMFDKFGPVRSDASIREEAQRLASLERKAAKAKAAAPRGKTAEEIRFELKNPVFGPEAPAGSRSSWSSDAASLREEEARSAREMMEEGFDQFEMDLGDIFGRGDD